MGNWCTRHSQSEEIVFGFEFLADFYVSLPQGTDERSDHFRDSAGETRLRYDARERDGVGMDAPLHRKHDWNICCHMHLGFARMRKDRTALDEEKEAVTLLNEMAIHLATYPFDAWVNCSELNAVAHNVYEAHRKDIEARFTALASRRLNRVRKETSKRKRK